MKTSSNNIRFGNIAVIELECDSKKTKLLSQNERKLISIACEAIKNESDTDLTDSEKEAWKNIIEKLRMPSPDGVNLKLNEKIRFASHLFLRSIKGFLNIFGARVSSSELSDKIHQTAQLSLDKENLYFPYQNCLQVFQTLISKNKLLITEEKKNTLISHIMDTIESFFLISIYKDETIKLNNNMPYFENPGALYLNEKTGLVIHSDESPIDRMLEHAPNLLIETFQVAQQKQRLADFFLEAFDSKGICFEARYDQLSSFYEKLVAEENKVSSNVGITKTFIPLIDQNKSKLENIGFCIKGFTEIQALEYASQNNLPIDKDWDKLKNEIIDRDDFRTKFLNVDSYQKFLTEKVQIVGKNGSDGIFSEEELPDLIDYYVKMDMIASNE